MHPVNGPEQYAGNKLEEGGGADVPHRFCAPHFHNLRHEPEAGESRRYRAEGIPSYVVHWLSNMLDSHPLAVKGFKGRISDCQGIPKQSGAGAWQVGRLHHQQVSS